MRNLNGDMLICAFISFCCGIVLCYCLSCENAIAIIMSPVFAIFGIGIIIVIIEALISGRVK